MELPNLDNWRLLLFLRQCSCRDGQIMGFEGRGLLVFHPPFTRESGVTTVCPIHSTNCLATCEQQNPGLFFGRRATFAWVQLIDKLNLCNW